MALKYDETTGKLVQTADADFVYNVDKPTYSYNVDKPADFTYEDAPTYTDNYKDQIDALYNQILNREAFSYDPQKDEAYKQYEQTYTREGNRAMRDTLAQVSARTGGLASTYAASSAQQANQYYMQQLADKIPELRQLAYDMYLSDLNNQRSDLDMLRGLSNDDYGRYRDTMSDYYTNRDFSYGQYRDSVNDYYTDRDFTYGQYRDDVSDYYTDRDFTYGQYRDDISDQNYYAESLYDQNQDKIDNDIAKAELAIQQSAEGRAQSAFDKENTVYDDDVVAVAAKLGITNEQALALKNTGSEAFKSTLAQLGIKVDDGIIRGTGNVTDDSRNTNAAIQHLQALGVDTSAIPAADQPLNEYEFNSQLQAYKTYGIGTPDVVAFKSYEDYLENWELWAYEEYGKK